MIPTRGLASCDRAAYQAVSASRSAYRLAGSSEQVLCLGRMCVVDLLACRHLAALLTAGSRVIPEREVVPGAPVGIGHRGGVGAVITPIQRDHPIRRATPR